MMAFVFTCLLFFLIKRSGGQLLSLEFVWYLCCMDRLEELLAESILKNFKFKIVFKSYKMLIILNCMS